MNARSNRYPYKHLFICLTGCLLFMSTLPSCSTHNRNRGRIPEIKEAQSADQIILQMKSAILLSDEQENRIRPIIEQQVQERKTLMKKYAGRDRQRVEALRDDLKDLRISTEKQLQYHLTNEQMIKYGYMQQEEDQRLSSGNAPSEAGQTIPRDRGRRPGR